MPKLSESKFETSQQEWSQLWGENESLPLTCPCVNWVSCAMVSFTCPCCGRGAGEAEDCRLPVGAPDVNPFCPGAEETELGVEMAVETGWPLMICVTTCWGAPTQTAEHLKLKYCSTSHRWRHYCFSPYLRGKGTQLAAYKACALALVLCLQITPANFQTDRLLRAGRCTEIHSHNTKPVAVNFTQSTDNPWTGPVKLILFLWIKLTKGMEDKREYVK